jgi:hypothetical protein
LRADESKVNKIILSNTKKQWSGSRSEVPSDLGLLDRIQIQLFCVDNHYECLKG